MDELRGGSQSHKGGLFWTVDHAELLCTDCKCKKNVNTLSLKEMGGKKMTEGPDWRSGSHVDNRNRLDFSWCLRVDLNTPLCGGVSAGRPTASGPDSVRPLPLKRAVVSVRREPSAAVRPRQPANGKLHGGRSDARGNQTAW